MPCNGYIAGRAISHWETDTDNIDVDYRTLSGQPSLCQACIQCIQRQKGSIVNVLVVVITFLLGILVTYLTMRSRTANSTPVILHITPHNNCSSATSLSSGRHQGYNETVALNILSRLGQRGNYAQHIRVMAGMVNLGGSAHTYLVLRDYIRKLWMNLAFDKVRLSNYSTDLSYPQLEKLSYVSVVAQNGSELFHSRTNVSADHPEYLPFNAYSPSAVVTSQLVYASYGRHEDFLKLRDRGISVKGNIVLIKYGIIHPPQQVQNAERHGAAGVVFYSDPRDYANRHAHTNGHAWWLPSWASKSAQVAFVLAGARYTSDNGEIFIDKSNYPKIPSQPISSSDALALLRMMRGPESQTTDNASPSVGPGFAHPFSNSSVRLAVYNSITHRRIYNAVAVIYGCSEPDKYVIIGAHHDSWTFGAVEMGTGVAVLMELASSFTQQTQQGWRPRRTIIFTVWGASMYGHMGAYNWAQKYAPEIVAGAVAYINLDSAVVGDYSFYSEANPMLHDVIMQATRAVSSPDADHHDLSVFHLWSKHFPSPRNHSLPHLPYPGGDGDHTPFEYFLGVPTASPSYTFNRNAFRTLLSHPAAGTLADTFDYIHKYVDPHMNLHATLAKIIARIVLRLVDSDLLPLNPHPYLAELNRTRMTLLTHRAQLARQNISLVSLIQGIERCGQAIQSFCNRLDSLVESTVSEAELDRLNHRLMHLTRLFVTKTCATEKPIYRNVAEVRDHVIFQFDIKDAMVQAKLTANWSRLRDWVAMTLHALESATRLLSQTII